MYAVIESGGKQYRVEVGTELEVELLDAEPGQSVTLDRVLLVADGDEAAIGRPVVADAAVEAEVVRRDRADKVIVFKYRPKARRRVKKGHRQDLTVLRITDVRFNGKSAAEFARFRLSGDMAAANATGLATGGEVEDYPAIYNVDTLPDAFDFTNQTNVPLSSLITSAPITVTGINAATFILISERIFLDYFLIQAKTSRARRFLSASEFMRISAQTARRLSISIGSIMPRSSSPITIVSTMPA